LVRHLEGIVIIIIITTSTTIITINIISINSYQSHQILFQPTSHTLNQHTQRRRLKASHCCKLHQQRNFKRNSARGSKVQRDVRFAVPSQDVT
jgi:hypothetical protein